MSDNTAQRAPAYFFYLAQGHCHSTAGEAARMLLHCYSGHRFRFNATDGQLLDAQHQDMALQIKRMNVHCTREVHERLNAMYGHTEYLGLRFL